MRMARAFFEPNTRSAPVSIACSFPLRTTITDEAVGASGAIANEMTLRCQTRLVERPQWPQVSAYAQPLTRRCAPPSPAKRERV